MLHTNSMLSSREVEKFNRRLTILEAFRKAKTPLTDRQVMKLCGFTDGNSVKPRITEMVEEGHLIEVGSEKDELTGRRVRLTAPRPKDAQQEMEF